MKNYKYLLILLVFNSCNSIKFKDFVDEDEFVKLNRKINSITCYSISNRKITDTSKTIIYYNDKRLPIKQVDFYKKRTIQATYVYDDKNRLLEENIGDPLFSISKYEYDKKGNLILYQSIKNDSVKVEKRYIYEKSNNPIKVIYSKGNFKDTTNYSYDYSKRTKTSTYSSKNFTRFVYDKKENIILSENHNPNNGTVSSNTRKYNKNGNLIERIGWINGKQNFKSEYKHKYDNQKNLIETSIFQDGKFIKKSWYIIEYK